MAGLIVLLMSLLFEVWWHFASLSVTIQVTLISPSLDIWPLSHTPLSQRIKVIDIRTRGVFAVGLKQEKNKTFICYSDKGKFPFIKKVKKKKKDL